MSASHAARARNARARHAEALVAKQLSDQGYVVLARNQRIGPYELDIVAQRGQQLIVCEVRCRSDATWVHPAQTLTRKKQDALKRGVAALLSANPSFRSLAVRIDVAAVILGEGPPDVTYFEGAL